MKTTVFSFSLLFAFLLLYSCTSTDSAGNNGQSGSTYQASTEEYNRTFKDIENLLDTLNSIIQKKDFESWKTHCTPEYLDRYSNQAVLNELSETPQLSDNRIRLASLKDYFIHVFIPSRLNIKLSRIDFQTSRRVKAITIINMTPYIVYLLEKGADNTWKLGVW